MFVGSPFDWLYIFLDKCVNIMSSITSNMTIIAQELLQMWQYWSKWRQMRQYYAKCDRITSKILSNVTLKHPMLQHYFECDTKTSNVTVLDE